MLSYRLVKAARIAVPHGCELMALRAFSVLAEPPALGMAGGAALRPVRRAEVAGPAVALAAPFRSAVVCGSGEYGRAVSRQVAVFSALVAWSHFNFRLSQIRAVNGNC